MAIADEDVSSPEGSKNHHVKRQCHVAAIHSAIHARSTCAIAASRKRGRAPRDAEISLAETTGSSEPVPFFDRLLAPLSAAVSYFCDGSVVAPSIFCFATPP